MPVLPCCIPGVDCLRMRIVGYMADFFDSPKTLVIASHDSAPLWDGLFTTGDPTSGYLVSTDSFDGGSQPFRIDSDDLRRAGAKCSRLHEDTAITPKLVGTGWVLSLYRINDTMTGRVLVWEGENSSTLVSGSAFVRTSGESTTPDSLSLRCCDEPSQVEDDGLVVSAEGFGVPQMDGITFGADPFGVAVFKAYPYPVDGSVITFVPTATDFAGEQFGEPRIAVRVHQHDNVSGISEEYATKKSNACITAKVTTKDVAQSFSTPWEAGTYESVAASARYGMVPRGTNGVNVLEDGVVSVVASTTVPCLAWLDASASGGGFVGPNVYASSWPVGVYSAFSGGGAIAVTVTSDTSWFKLSASPTGPFTTSVTLAGGAVDSTHNTIYASDTGHPIPVPAGTYITLTATTAYATGTYTIIYSGPGTTDPTTESDLPNFGTTMIPAAGATYTVVKKNNAGLAWNILWSSDPVEPFYGSGFGATFTMTVLPNRQCYPRVVSYAVAGMSAQTSTAKQEAAPATVTPTSASVSTAGGTVSIDVVPGDDGNCWWMVDAVSAGDISFDDGVPLGPSLAYGTLTFNVTIPAHAARTITLRVAWVTVTITQA